MKFMKCILGNHVVPATMPGQNIEVLGYTDAYPRIAWACKTCIHHSEVITEELPLAAGRTSGQDATGGLLTEEVSHAVVSEVER